MLQKNNMLSRFVLNTPRFVPNTNSRYAVTWGNVRKFEPLAFALVDGAALPLAALQPTR